MGSRTFVGLLALTLTVSRLVVAQDPLLTSSQDYFRGSGVAPAPPLSVRRTPGRLWDDQKKIWTSPLHLQTRDLRWLIPLGATTALLLATDSRSMERIHSTPADRSRSSTISDAGVALIAGATGISYLAGAAFHNSHAQRTGLLAARSMADAFLVTEAFKLVGRRDRPVVNGGAGNFWSETSLNSSFPSMHTSLAWSAATVFAHEYPKPATQLLAYGLASIVGISRVTAEKHFPTDVLIGAATGYLIGRYVSRSSREELTYQHRVRPAHVSSGPAVASVYVPLDSWMYPALRRLGDFGLIPDQVSNLAPWTRSECLRQVKEAAARLAQPETALRSADLQGMAMRTVADLRAELEPQSDSDNVIRFESIYTRVTGIAGQPLRDSYHFGQTIGNDFGRPYDQGFNNVTGFSSYAVSGRLSAYVRGEYQYAPGRDAEPTGTRDLVSRLDQVPSLGNGAIATTNRFRTQEMYVGAQLGWENITFGKQNLWWGPGDESAYSFSNNAEPFYMLRFAQTQPLVLPGPFRYLGKIRTDIVFGKLSGHRFPARPYMTAQKISLDLTNDLEVGFTRSSFFGGVGHPLTFGALKETLLGVNSVDVGPYGQRSDLPGDRHSGFDFRWRLPGLRHMVTIYSDSYADDEPNPLDNPRRSAWGPGLYLSHLPHLAHFDFRFETYSTWLYAKDFGGNFLYYNNQYRDSYTNNGYLLGSWIGRDSRAYVTEAGYWANAKTRFVAKYRQTKASPAFLPGGGTQTDVSVAGTWSATPEMLLTWNLQGERYLIPILGPPHRNFLTSFGVSFTPRNWVWR